MKRLILAVMLMGFVGCKKDGETITKTQYVPMIRNGTVTIYEGAITSDHQRITVNADILNHSDTQKVDVSLCTGAVCAPPPGVYWTAGPQWVELQGAQTGGYTTYAIATTVY